MVLILRQTLLAFWIGVVCSSPTIKNEERPSPEMVQTLFQEHTSSKPLRILAVFPMRSYSHHIMAETLMIGLARRGHQVTMLSPIPPREAIPNYHHVDTSDILPNVAHWTTFESFSRITENVHKFMTMIADFDGHKVCRDLFNHTKVKTLLSSPHKFDVVFAEIFGSGCSFAIGTKLQVPTIGIATTHCIQWMEDFCGDTSNPSYVESVFLTPTTDGLSSFIERIKNTFYYVQTKMAFYDTMTRPDEEVVRDFLGPDAPSLVDIRRNVSFCMVNTHPSVFMAKPTVPRVLPVGGLHLRPPSPDKMPSALRTWLEDAPKGVVFFSLGSVLRADTIPKDIAGAFASAFRELKHLRFLWKLDASEEQAKAIGIPDNVLVSKWLPQMEVLSHPNVKVFITHGGLMGSSEAIYTGVPMIGMPVFSDQIMNIFRYEKLGIAIRLDHRTVTKEEIVAAIIKATTNLSFRQRVQEVSSRYRDRPMSPLDSAIWWTEYIVRHKGAQHLESPAATMPLWKYALLDVVAVVLGVLLLALYIVYIILRTLLRCIIIPSHAKQRKEKKN